MKHAGKRDREKERARYTHRWLTCVMQQVSSLIFVTLQLGARIITRNTLAASSIIYSFDRETLCVGNIN